MIEKPIRQTSIAIATVAVVLASIPSLATATTSSQLAGMAVTQRFNASEASKSSYAANWSKLGWAAEKGIEETAGWGPAAGYPTVNGAFNTATITDTGAGIAAVVTLTEPPIGKDYYFSLWLDATGSSATRTGYELRFTEEGTFGPYYKVTLSKWQSGTQTVLESQLNYNFQTKPLALVDEGSTVSVWTKTGSEFSKVMSVSDSTFASGNGGIEGAGNLTRLQDFKVGSLLEPIETTNEAIKGLALIDSFGTNESPLSGGAKWSALSWANGSSGHNTGHVSGGWAPYDAYPTINGAYWNSATFADTGAGTGVAVTLAAKPENLSRYFSLWLAMPAPASTRSGYELRFTETSSGIYEVSLLKWVSGTKTALNSKSNYSFATNRDLALVEREGTVSVWTNPTGEGYTQILTAKDSTFTSGYSGVEGSGNITRLKNFKAGHLPPLLSPSILTNPVLSLDPPLQAVPETTTNGTWTSEVASYTYKWLRCKTEKEEGKEFEICSYIFGANAATYTPEKADVGYKLKAEVTATNMGGAVAALSKPTNIVEPIGEIKEYSLAGKGPTVVAPGSDGNLWVGAYEDILRISPTGKVTGEYTVPVEAYINDMVTGPDKNIWYTAEDGYLKNDYIIRLSPVSLEQTVYKLPEQPSFPWTLASGPDGNLWYVGNYSEKIGKVTTSGTVTQYPAPSGNCLDDITAGPDGKLWLTDSSSDVICSLTTSGTFTEYSLPAKSDPDSIIAGPDGKLWFTNFGTDKIGRITTSGSITETKLPTGSDPNSIAVGADGSLWFTEYGTSMIGRITTAGVVGGYAIPGGGKPRSIVSGPDSRLWFVTFGSESLGRIVP